MALRPRSEIVDKSDERVAVLKEIAGCRIAVFSEWSWTDLRFDFEGRPMGYSGLPDWLFAMLNHPMYKGKHDFNTETILPELPKRTFLAVFPRFVMELDPDFVEDIKHRAYGTKSTPLLDAPKFTTPVVSQYERYQRFLTFYRERLLESFFVFMMGTHSRVGADSPLSLVNGYGGVFVLQHIAEFLPASVILGF